MAEAKFIKAFDASGDAQFAPGLLQLTPTVLDQFSYRFRKDDGSEAAATWEDDQNSPAGVLADSKIRVRIGVNISSEYIARKACQLEYRHKSAGGVFSAWTKA